MIIILKKKIFFPILALAIIGTALVSSTLVSAQDTTRVSSLVTAIAQKFNLNETDVRAVFDEERTQREAEMKAQMEEKLAQAVKDGKITTAQKQAILEKFGTSFTKKIEPGQFKEMSAEQMKTFHEQRKAEMETWLSQNGLTKEVLNEVLGHPKRFGQHRAGFMSH